MGEPPFLGFEIYNLPTHLRDEVLTIMHNNPGLEHSRQPCYWFDMNTRRCVEYNHRPQICRDFEVGCNACINYRENAIFQGIIIHNELDMD